MTAEVSSTRRPGGIGIDCLKDIAAHGTLSPYWDPMNLIWIAQELVRNRERLTEARLLLDEVQARHAADPMHEKIYAFFLELRNDK